MSARSVVHGKTGPVAAAQTWLGSGSWPADIAGFVLALVLAVLSVGLTPVLWVAVLAAEAFLAPRDRLSAHGGWDR